VKKLLFAVMLVATMCWVASAADVKAHLGGKGDANFHGTPGWGNPPATAANLIFYGGDTNVSDPNEDGFATGDTLLVPNASSYGAVKAPSKVVATGILFNEIATALTFDPAQATYDIRTGVSEGNGGHDLLSGSGAQTATPTGRMPFGAYTEYAASVNFTKPVTATKGVTYWVNLGSECTNSGDGNCQEQFFVDNTTQQTNGINANLQPPSEMFFNSTYFGFTWANWCDSSLGTNAQQCEWMSFGIYGH
jgi:opacity protein-like surface antigen